MFCDNARRMASAKVATEFDKGARALARFNVHLQGHGEAA
jgi:hypothetical protein